MQLARVVGTVVASRKEPTMVGRTLLLLRVLDAEAGETSSHLVAADAVGAGVGDVVLFATGSSARQTEVTKDRPCDCAVMAIVDTWELGERRVYDKKDD